MPNHVFNTLIQHLGLRLDHFTFRVTSTISSLIERLAVPINFVGLTRQNLFDTYNAFGQVHLLPAGRWPGFLQPFRQVILYIRTDGFDLLIVHKHTSNFLIANYKSNIIQMPNRHRSALVTPRLCLFLEADE